MEQRTIKFRFVIDGKELSKPYDLAEFLVDKNYENILEDMEKCTCQFNESNTQCECQSMYENSEITGKVQFTGLLDKNGKEIYEGDLVNYSFDDVLNIKCGDYIKFDAGYFQIYREGKTYHPVISDAKYIEVIGNIYEPPSPLKAHTNGKET